MGDLMNISAAQYSKIENGRCHINLHHIETLAYNLDITFPILYCMLKEMVMPNLEPKEKPGLPENIYSITSISLEHAITRLRDYCIHNNHSIVIAINGNVTINSINENATP